MPFKWRLKKTRKYDISTKNVFIVGVYLLDNAYLECTLTADSTGQECLNSITQRMELAESRYFGLRYVTKKLSFHWVDLEKPLKKQLDKYAQPGMHPHNVYFGVMFYVLGAHKIPDEVARYHYYLQLKTDIIDGRLPCSKEQAVRLAAYSLQAEFGDYEPDKYTAEDYFLFPKNLMQDKAVASELLSEAIAGHAALKGVPPLRAELQYVKEVQMMDGYGAEYYTAKDESRKDLYLGTSHAGIFARHTEGQSTVYYKWAEIAKVTQNKKTLEIDTSKSSVQFQLEDTDTAKYVARLAQLQSQFYKSSKGSLSTSLTDVSLSEEVGVRPYIDAQQVYIPPLDSSNSSQELGHSQTSLTHSQEQRYTQEVAGSCEPGLEVSESPHTYQHQQHHHHHPQQQHQHHHPQQQHHHQVPGIELEADIGNGSLHHQQITRHESLTPAPDSDPVYVNRAALLPAYRPSPDYDAVMQQRIIQQQHMQSQFEKMTPHLGAAQVYVHPDGVSYSQPEISQNMAAMYTDQHGNYANVDNLRSYSHSICANIFQDNYSYLASRGTDRANNLAVHATYSSPELNKVSQQEVFAASEFSAQEAMAYHFRPPPPYPRASSSTPDLAAQPVSNLVSNQPDLVVPDLAGGHDHAGVDKVIIQSRLDRSVEDLSGFQVNTAYSVTGITPVSDLVETSNASIGSHLTGHVGSSDADSTRTDAGAVSRMTPAGVYHSDLTMGADNTNRVLSDDLDDTSSEHSYSTFHAKESDESSDDDVAKMKSAQAKKDSNIQIRMFTPQQAPPPSKFKEEATLRESFRRMKIARTSSLSKDAQGGLRSSLCRLKEATEAHTHSSHVAAGASQQSQPLVNPSVTPADMEEVLERLGAPPPYPGQPAVLDMVSDVPVVRDSSSTSAVVQNKPSMFQRSSSLGMPPQTSRQTDDMSAASRPRVATLSLDTIVPISRPGVVHIHKQAHHGTSVLQTPTDGDADATTSLSNKGLASAGEQQVSYEDRSDAGDNVSSLQGYCLGSDSDSDLDQTPASDSQLHMGPLKIAALNGLTLSRSVVLSFVNDDSRAPTDDRRKMLESKISEGQVYAEFEQIPRKSDSLECQVARAPHNATRNRFKDVLPYDITRVQLTPRKDNPDGYINASHIKLTANDTKWLFIATQAPLEHTAIDFWQMIWEKHIDVVAMLTPFQELGKSKCFVYWPQEPGPQHRQTYGEYQVELQFTDDSLCYLTSRIILRHAGREHLLWHLQYTDWPDHGCPEDTYGFLGFLDEIEAVARLAETEAGRGERSPVVVHCSAGVGRTGVVILTMVMKWCLEHNHNVDLPKALSGIRNQRMHMVQTMGQYRFIHDTLIQYLKNTRLI